MDIGFLCYSLSGAGPRVRARTLISSLADRTDHDVTLVTAADGNFAHEDVEIHPLLSRDRLLSPRTAWNVREALKDCDVVHVPVNVYQLMYAAICGLRPRVAGAGIQHEPRYRYLTRIIGVDMMIETHDQVAEFWTNSGVPATYIYPTVDRTAFHPRSETERRSIRSELGIPSEQDVVLFVGELKELKGADLVAELPEYFDDGDVTLVVVGDGSYRDRFTDRDEIHFEGFVENEALPVYYAAADVTVVPSRQESFSIVSLESIACGTPVVTTTKESSPMARIFKDRGTYVWTERTPEAVARTTRELLADSDRYEKQVQRGFETIESMGLTIDHALDKYVDVYESVVEGDAG